ncbi:MAG: hypothetical protein ABI557_09185, partial [Aureliella sp.]
DFVKKRSRRRILIDGYKFQGLLSGQSCMKSPQVWRCLPLSRQLLISVNSVLIVVLANFLVVDYLLRY